MAVLHLRPGGRSAPPAPARRALTVLALVLLVLAAAAVLLAVEQLTDSGVITLAPPAEAAVAGPGV